MKNLNFTKAIITALFFAVPFLSKAQDIIIKTDKSEIKSKVLELTDDAIKYKKFEALDGPTYSVKKAAVFMILYKNGTKEYMDNPTPPVVVQPSAPPMVANRQATKVEVPVSEATWEPTRLLGYYNSTDIPDGVGGTISSSALTVEATFDGKLVQDYLNWGFGSVLSAGSTDIPDYTYTSTGGVKSNGTTSVSSTGYGIMAYLSAYVGLNKLMGATNNLGTGFFPFARGGYQYVSVSSGGSSASAGDGIFEFGLDYKFGKKFAVTVVTSKFESFGGGISFLF